MQRIIECGYNGVFFIKMDVTKINTFIDVNHLLHEIICLISCLLSYPLDFLMLANSVYTCELSSMWLQLLSLCIA